MSPQARTFIPERLVLLERFGAAYYAYLFLDAQGAPRARARSKAVRAARRYLAAGGTSRGIERAVLLAQSQTRDLLEDWYGASVVRGFGPRGAALRRLLSEIERR